MSPNNHHGSHNAYVAIPMDASAQHGGRRSEDRRKILFIAFSIVLVLFLLIGLPLVLAHRRHHHYHSTMMMIHGNHSRPPCGHHHNSRMRGTNHDGGRDIKYISMDYFNLEKVQVVTIEEPVDMNNYQVKDQNNVEQMDLAMEGPSEVVVMIEERERDHVGYRGRRATTQRRCCCGARWRPE